MHGIGCLMAALCLAACGGGSAQAEPSTASTASPAPVGPERPWEDLTFDERRAHMGRHVMPVMTDLFVAYDSARYADFSCATCHGEGVANGDFAMPNPALPTVYPSGTLGQRQMVDDNPEGARFMFSRVIPAMQTLLGREPYDPATGTGMSCFTCHPSAAADDPLAAPHQ